MLSYQISYKSKANLARLGARSFIPSQNPIISTGLFSFRLRSLTYLFHCTVSWGDFAIEKNYSTILIEIPILLYSLFPFFFKAICGQFSVLALTVQTITIAREPHFWYSLKMVKCPKISNRAMKIRRFPWFSAQKRC